MDNFRLPSEIESEQYVLGIILQDPKMLDQAAILVKVEAFYFNANRTIYEAMIAIATSGEVVDFVTLTSYLRNQNKLEAVGGATYIASLVNALPVSDNLRPYTNKINEAYKRRTLSSKLALASDKALDATEPLGDIITQIEEEIFVLGANV